MHTTRAGNPAGKTILIAPLVKRYGAECPVEGAVKILRCAVCGALGQFLYEDDAV